MAQIRLQISCKWTKRRATWSIVALLPWQCCLATCQQVSSRPQAISPDLLMMFSSLRGCGLCTGVLSEVLRYLLPGKERLLQVCQELKLQVNCRKLSLIPSQDMTYLDMQIQSVRFLANPTPFISYSSGKGWDIMDTMFPDSPRGPGGTSETSSFASLGILCIRRILYGGLGRFNNERT